jgi:hypothetical protein
MTANRFSSRRRSFLQIDPRLWTDNAQIIRMPLANINVSLHWPQNIFVFLQRHHNAMQVCNLLVPPANLAVGCTP